MGTRADFYIGDGPEAEWLGSIAWDGYLSGIPDNVLNCQDEAEFRTVVTEFLMSREDGTLPEMGWPWPWDTSETTDCCYAFKGGKVLSGWWGSLYKFPEDDRDDQPTIGGNFPNMKERKNMTFGERSGIILIGG